MNFALPAQFEAQLIEEPDEGAATKLSFTHFWRFVAQEAVDAAVATVLPSRDDDTYATPSRR